MSGWDPNSVASWHSTLAKASAALQANPNDQEAQIWRDRALQNITDLETFEKQRETTQASDLGSGAAFGLGAARGASFGLGDVAQRLFNSPQEQQAVATTTAEHPTSSALGTLAGSAVPFVAGAGLGAGAPLARTAIAGAQGFGLSSGDVGDRTKGAVMAAALARYGPEALSAASRVTRGVTGRLGSLLLRGSGEAPAAAAPTVPSIDEEAFRLAPMQGASAERMGEIRDFLAKRGAALDAEQAWPKSGQTPAISQGPPGSNKPVEPMPGTGGRGFTAEGPPTPARPSTPSFREQVDPQAKLGKGKTLPYYPRGGAAEQALPPSPVTTPPVVPPAIQREVSDLVQSEGLAKARVTLQHSGALQDPFYRRALQQIMADLMSKP